MTTNYCRLCMAEVGLEVINTFTRNALRNEFSLVIHPNDGLSNDICKKCAKLILKFVDFKRNITTVQKVLKKVMKKKTSTGEQEDESLTSSGALKPEKTSPSHNEEGLSDEKGAPILESSPARVRKRKRESSISESKPSKITIKTEPTSSDELSDDCTMEEIPQKNAIIKIEDDSDEKIDSNQFQCKFCSAIFGYVEGLSKHLKKHHDSHLCIQCGFISLNARSYAKHLRTHYNLTCAHRICLSCFKICNDPAEFYAHRKLVHDAGRSLFVCSDCSLEFVAVEEFEEHKRQVHKTTDSETDENTWVCISDDESRSRSCVEKVVDLKKSHHPKTESNCTPDSTARDEELEPRNTAESGLNSQKPDTSKMKSAPNDINVTSRAETSEYYKSSRFSTSSQPDNSRYQASSKRSRSPKSFHSAPSTSSEFAAPSRHPPPLIIWHPEDFQRNTEDAQYIPGKHSSTARDRSEKTQRCRSEQQLEFPIEPPEQNSRPLPNPTKYKRVFSLKDGWYHCRICHSKFESPNDRELHYIKCLPRRTCKVCGASFSCHEEMKLHDKIRHKNQHPKPEHYEQQFQQIRKIRSKIKAMEVTAKKRRKRIAKKQRRCVRK